MATVVMTFFLTLAIVAILIDIDFFILTWPVIHFDKLYPMLTGAIMMAIFFFIYVFFI